MPGVETAFENFLLRIFPDLDQTRKGAEPEQIHMLARLAGRPLPKFYRWFLEKMGSSMGPAAYKRVDFSASRILSCYAANLYEPGSNLLLIGFDIDPLQPHHYMYDLELQTRDDARILRMDATGSLRTDTFETFREMLAWNKMLSAKIESRSYHCSGIFEDDMTIAETIAAVADQIGFQQPIETGPCCGIFERPDAAMIYSIAPDDVGPLRVFDLGCDDEGTLRRILGTMASETSIEVEVNEWHPAP